MALRDNPVTIFIFSIFCLYLCIESFMHTYNYELPYFSLHITRHLIEYIGDTLGCEALGIFFLSLSVLFFYSSISELIAIKKGKIINCPSCEKTIVYEYDYSKVPYSKKCKHCGHEF